MMDDWELGVRNPGRLCAVMESGLMGMGPEDAFDRLIELAVEADRRTSRSHRSRRLRAHHGDELSGISRRA